MPAIDFPNSPTVGQTYEVNGRVWVWTGASWDVVSRVVEVPNTLTISVGAGLTASTDTSSVPGFKITTFTAGTGTISFS